MRSTTFVGSTVLAGLCAFGACGESSSPVQPTGTVGGPAAAASPAGGGFAAAAEPGGPQIMIRDECDPDSFNANVRPGTCVDRQGGLPYDTFIALLTKMQRVPAWRFSPETIHVAREATLPLVNAGGEVHTFTEVEEFGGGIVPALNALSGTPEPAPECLALAGADFLAPGAHTTHHFEPGEEEKYQCCIHPWMRAVAR